MGLAFFEFAPLSGAGMGTACACTTPTGAKGESLTFTRASNGTCTKTATGGLATTEIANGDLVVCSTDQPRVEYDSSGTLGLLVEAARTNSALRSQEFDNAAWTARGIIAAVPVITANFGVAPDGTTTAERVQFAATTSAADTSDVYQIVAPAPGASTSIFVKGNGTPGTIDLCSYEGTAWSCVDCNYVTATWTRCVHPRADGPGPFENVRFGNASLNNPTHTLRAANDVLIWGAQWEDGSYVTSYIPNTSAAVTRATESASFAIALPGAAGSAAATFSPQHTGSSDSVAVGGPQVFFGAAARPLQGFNNSLQTYDGTNNPVLTANYVAGTHKRTYSTWSTAGGWVLANSTDGTQTTSAFNAGTWSPTTTLCLSNCGSFTPSGIQTKTCYDPNPTRCR